MVSATDGSAVTTGTPTVYVTGDGGTQATGTGTAAHEGNGCWSYIPTQAETNYDHVAFTMALTAAINQTVQVYTTFPQTADAPTAADILAEVQSALDEAFTDATSLTAGGLKDRLRSLGWIVRNKMVITEATGDTTLYKDDNTTAGFTVTGMFISSAGTTTRLRAE